MVFEGSEKKLEITFNDKSINLLNCPLSLWNDIVASVDAKIISKVENDEIKSYLLSESSLFVYKNKVVLITCGQTKLINCLENFVDKFGEKGILSIFYERKNEIFGQYQSSHFFDDIKIIEKYFKGKSLRFGEASGHHVFLYSYLSEDCLIDSADSTLEVLMYGIEGEAKELFQTSGYNSSLELRHAAGLDSLLEGYEIDDYIFDPVGYSLNAIRGDQYLTIHVTPESIGNYTSFEATGIPAELQIDVLRKVLSIFKPTLFDVFSFAPQKSHYFDCSGYNKKREYGVKLENSFDINFTTFYKPQIKKQLPIFF